MSKSDDNFPLDCSKSGTAYSNDLNDVLEAIDSSNSGTQTPTSNLQAGKLWLDTGETPPILKTYDTTVNQFVPLGLSGDAFRSVVIYKNAFTKPDMPSTTDTILNANLTGFDQNTADVTGAWFLEQETPSSGEDTYTSVGTFKQTESTGAYEMEGDWSDTAQLSGNDGSTGPRSPVIGFYVPMVTRVNATTFTSDLADFSPVGLLNSTVTDQNYLDASFSQFFFGNFSSDAVGEDYGVFYNNSNEDENIVASYDAASANWIVGTKKISGNLLVDGSITADSLDADAITGKIVKGGKIDFTSTVSGFFLDGTTGEFVVGGDANNQLRWDGSNLTIPAATIGNGITSTQIADGAITTNKIEAGAITAVEIEANSISADKLTSLELSVAKKISVGSIRTGAEDELDDETIIGANFIKVLSTIGFPEPGTLLIGGTETFTYATLNADGQTFNSLDDTVEAEFAAGTIVVEVIPGYAITFGSGVVLDGSGKFAVGDTTNAMTFDGTDLRLNGVVVDADNIALKASIFEAQTSANGEREELAIKTAGISGDLVRLADQFRTVTEFETGSETLLNFDRIVEGDFSTRALRQAATAVVVGDTTFTGPFTSGDGTILDPEVLTSIGASLLNASDNAVIDAGKIRVNEINANLITANSITADQIAANSITADEIAADAITASEISADAITAKNISSEAASGFVTIPETGPLNITFDDANKEGYYINNDGRFIFGNQAKSIDWNGTELTVTGDVISTSNINTAAITVDKVATNSFTGTSFKGTWTESDDATPDFKGELYFAEDQVNPPTRADDEEWSNIQQLRFFHRDSNDSDFTNIFSNLTSESYIRVSLNSTNFAVLSVASSTLDGDFYRVNIDTNNLLQSTGKFSQTGAAVEVHMVTEPDSYIDGNLVVDGTITAKKIVVDGDILITDDNGDLQAWSDDVSRDWTTDGSTVSNALDDTRGTTLTGVNESGFFLGNTDDGPRFFLGTAAGVESKFMKWTGDELVITGDSLTLIRPIKAYYNEQTPSTAEIADNVGGLFAVQASATNKAIELAGTNVSIIPGTENSVIFGNKDMTGEDLYDSLYGELNAGDTCRVTTRISGLEAQQIDFTIGVAGGTRVDSDGNTDANGEFTFFPITATQAGTGNISLSNSGGNVIEFAWRLYPETSKAGLSVDDLTDGSSYASNMSIGAFSGTAGIEGNTSIGFRAGEGSRSVEETVATAILAGRPYRILTVGTTDFTAIGSTNNSVGTTFVATGAGTGTGIATLRIISDGTKRNTAVGAEALNAFAASSSQQFGQGDNTAIGVKAGWKLLGTENTLIGSRAGESLVGIPKQTPTDSINNTFVGFRAGGESINSTDNTFIGHLAGVTAGLRDDATNKGEKNTFVGSGADSNTNLITQDGAVAVGYKTKANDHGTSVGTNAGAKVHAVAIGGSDSGASANKTTAFGERSIAIGYKSDVPNDATDAISIGANSSATLLDAVAIGNSAKADGEGSIAIGGGSSSDDQVVASGTNSIVIGNGAGNPSALDDANFNIMMGTNAGGTLTDGTQNVLIGSSAGERVKAGNDNVSIGNGAGLKDDTIGSVAVGHAAKAEGDESVSIGRFSRADGLSSTALGTSTDATGASSVAVGDGAQAIEDNTISIGKDSENFNDSSTAIGRNAKAGEIIRFYGDLGGSFFPGFLGAGDWKFKTGTHTIGDDPDDVSSPSGFTTGNHVFYLANLSNLSEDNFGTGPNNRAFFSSLSSGDTGRFKKVDSFGVTEFTLTADPIYVFDDTGDLVDPISSEDNEVWVIQVNISSVTNSHSSLSTSSDTSVNFSFLRDTSYINMVSIGSQAGAAGTDAIAIGSNSASTDVGSIAIGPESNATGFVSTSIGAGSAADGQFALAVGLNANASGENSTAIGESTSASGENSTAVGTGAIADEDNLLVLGNSATTSRLGKQTGGDNFDIATKKYVDENGGGAGEENVQSDWSQTDTGADDYIENKPTTITGAQATAIGTNSTHSSSSHAPSGAEANVQSDWSQTDTGADDYIENKPTTITGAQATAIGTNSTHSSSSHAPSGAEANVQSDWSQTDTGADDYIENKPTTITGAQATAIGTNSTHSSSSHAPSGAEANVQSDWSQTDTGADDYIENKPTTITGAQATAIGTNSTHSSSSHAPSGAEANVQSDWSQTDTGADDYIENKPTTITGAQATAIGTNSTHSSSSHAPSGAEANVQSDWSQTDTGADDYIENKPTTITGAQATAIGTNSTHSSSSHAPSGAEANVQSDWSQTDTGADDYIENKPTTITGAQATAIGTNSTHSSSSHAPSGAEANVQSDWSQTDTGADDYIENKPTTITGAQATAIGTNSTHSSSSHAPSGAEANVQSDWSQTDTGADDYIENKPTTITTAQVDKLKYFNVRSDGDGANILNFGTDTIAIGEGSLIAGTASIAIGRLANAAVSGTIAMGDEAGSSKDDGIAIGRLAKATAFDAIAIGETAKAGSPNTTGFRSVAIAKDSRAFGADSIAIGKEAEAGVEDDLTIFDSIAIGKDSISSHVFTVAVGSEAKADGPASTVVGYRSTAPGFAAIAIGADARSTDSSGSSLGNNAYAIGNESIALGTNSIAGGIPKFYGYLGGGTFNNGRYAEQAGAWALLAGAVTTTPNDAANNTLTGWSLGTHTLYLGNISSTFEASATALVGDDGAEGVSSTANNDFYDDMTVGTKVEWSTRQSGKDQTFVQFEVTIAPAYFNDDAGGSAQNINDDANEAWRIGINVTSVGDGLDSGLTSNPSGPTLVGTTFQYLDENGGCISIGADTRATGLSCVAMGGSADATGIFSTAIGRGAQATGRFSASLGAFAQANGEDSVAIGISARANGTNSTAIGNEALPIVSGSPTRTLWVGNETATSEGSTTKASTSTSHTFFSNLTAGATGRFSTSQAGKTAGFVEFTLDADPVYVRDDTGGTPPSSDRNEAWRMYITLNSVGTGLESGLTEGPTLVGTTFEFTPVGGTATEFYWGFLGGYNEGTGNFVFGSGGNWTLAEGTSTEIPYIAANNTETGWGATADNSNNLIGLGNGNIVGLQCNVQTISTISDSRDKADVADLSDSDGLPFINGLQPRTFYWDRREWYDDGVPDGSKKKVDYSPHVPNSGKRMGFIAQETEVAMKGLTCISESNLVTGGGLQKQMAYAELITPMVKAIQQLSSENEAMKARLDALDGGNTVTPPVTPPEDPPGEPDDE